MSETTGKKVCGFRWISHFRCASFPGISSFYRIVIAFLLRDYLDIRIKIWRFREAARY